MARGQGGKGARGQGGTVYSAVDGPRGTIYSATGRPSTLL